MVLRQTFAIVSECSIIQSPDLRGCDIWFRKHLFPCILLFYDVMRSSFHSIIPRNYSPQTQIIKYIASFQTPTQYPDVYNITELWHGQLPGFLSLLEMSQIIELLGHFITKRNWAVFYGLRGKNYCIIVCANGQRDARARFCMICMSDSI